MSEQANCLCDVFVHPRPPYNPPGRAALRYRVGDYLSFREALLRARPGEVELAAWRPGATGDLAVQLLEWFAYLADILTFYNERRANEAYLRTALLPESVQELVYLLGYRPRPGIGARGVVAALLQRPGQVVIPQGWPVQSKPGPGQEPQIFEVDQAVTAGWPDSVPADPASDGRLLIDSSVLLAGSISGIKPGELFLLLAKGWDGSDGRYALARVSATTTEADPRGNPNTRVTLEGNFSSLAGAQAQDYLLLRSNQSAPVWQYPTGGTPVINDNSVELSGISRSIHPGDPLLFDTGRGAGSAAGIGFRSAIQTVQNAGFRQARQTSVGARLRSLTSGSGGQAAAQIRRQFRGGRIVITPPQPQLVLVTYYTEQIWYANPDEPAEDPTKPPANPTPPISIPHTSLYFTPSLTGNFNFWRASVVMRFGWQDVGQLIATPVTTFNGQPQSLAAVTPATFPKDISQSVLVAGGDGTGVKATGTTGGNAGSLALTDLPQPAVPLSTPLTASFNLLSVSRGQTVNNEVLGSGDASIPGQEFTLQKSPLTYLLSTTGTVAGSYQSTLRVWVNGIEWQEVPSFYDRDRNAHVFVTREDADQKTHVMFGDGQYGSRLPSGTENVVATYRYGSGAAAPEAGKLTVVVQPLPNLRTIANPVAAGGGADPDPPDQIRHYAPRSVLTFGRAVSADDYEAIAAAAPGVARARAYWAWDEQAQRGLVTVYVGDDASAREAAQVALRGAADPNRPVTVKLAEPVAIRASLTLELDPAYLPAPVVSAATAALIDPDTGLFGANTVRIGASIHRSQVYAACLAVPGVVAVHSLIVELVHPTIQPRAAFGFGSVRLHGRPGFGTLLPGPRYDPGEGRFFRLAAGNLQVSQEAVAYAR
jgi:hypothetical protein